MVISNGDKIRAMSDEEIEEWYWWMYEVMTWSTNSQVFVHDWRKEEAKE